MLLLKVNASVLRRRISICDKVILCSNAGAHVRHRLRDRYKYLLLLLMDFRGALPGASTAPAAGSPTSPKKAVRAATFVSSHECGRSARKHPGFPCGDPLCAELLIWVSFCGPPIPGVRTLALPRFRRLKIIGQRPIRNAGSVLSGSARCEHY
jgi:hypothetical protein